MKTLRFLLGLVLLLSASQANAQRPMTTDDGLNMASVGNALLSPDGQKVLFRKTELNWEKNKRENKYHLAPAAGGASYQFIGQDGGSDVKFSPNGKYLTFKRSIGEKDKVSQLFIMRTDGGEAVQLTKHKTSIGRYVWTSDESAIYFVSDQPRSEEAQKEFKNGNDAIFVDEGPNGQTAASWQHLWKLDIESKKSRKVISDSIRISHFDVAPDQQHLLYIARTENRRNQGNLSEIHLLNLTDSTHTRLTRNEAPEARLMWAPDSRRFAYTAPDDKTWELRNDKIWMMDIQTQKIESLSTAFEGNIRSFAWTPDGSAILFTGLQRTNSNLYRLEVDSKKVTQITNLTGSLNALSYSKDRKHMVYSYSDLQTPADLYVSPTDSLNPTRITTLHESISDSLLLARSEIVRWKSQDGLEIEGILLFPPDYQTGERRPFLLHIHGGPAGVFTNSFRSQYHVWAGLGYVQLLPNVRGSSGYSDDFLRGNMHDIGGGDYWDLMTGVDHVLEQGYAHPEQLGVRGWSYGGILGGWTITQTDRFKGASLGAMVSDWTSEWGPGFNFDVRNWYIGGTPWDNPEEFRFRSALTHAKNIKTPTLLLHGIADRVDTEAQSMMLFSALKDMNKTVRYIKFPREPHGFREPRHQRVRDIEEIRWIQKYVRGIEWKAWERTPKAKETKEKPAKPVSP